MNLQVKEVGGNQEKSKAEIEEQLLKKHEESFADAGDNSNQPETISSEPEVTPEPLTIDDDSVLSYIKERYNKDIDSVDQLFETRESNEQLPDDVLKYFEYKKETGRGIEDFYKLQRDYDNMDEDSILADYMAIHEEGLDAIDIEDLMENSS